MDKIEEFIRMVYRRWKRDSSVKEGGHLNEEDLVCFLEDRLEETENERVRQHLTLCERCLEIVRLQAKIAVSEAESAPDNLLSKIKNLTASAEDSSILEIFLKAREKLLEIISTNGDILFGRELVPAPLLRSRQIKDFKDLIVVLKDFKTVRIQVKIENKEPNVFDLSITAKEKQTNKAIPALRIALIKEGVELESYLTDSGMVSFEHVLLGRYSIEVASAGSMLASISLDIKT